MKLLIDTVTFLHAALEPEKLSARAKALIGDAENDRFMSMISTWEITIKYGLRKVVLNQPPEQFVPEHRMKLAAEILPLDEESIFHLARLPLLHADPFDRLLICQAIVHGMILITPDPQISRYPVRTAW